MRRIGLIALIGLLVVSLTGNAVLGWAAWRAQGEYRALSRQFVKARQELAALKAAPASAAPASAAPAATAPAAAPPAAPAAASAQPSPQVAAPAPAPGGAEAVRARYTPRLLEIQAQCEGQLAAMLESAKAEYKAGGGKVDVAALGARYLAQADGLRRQCDRQVDAITREMAADLKAAGLPLDLVDEVREAYEARIVERQAEIMAKAPSR